MLIELYQNTTKCNESKSSWCSDSIRIHSVHCRSLFSAMKQHWTKRCTHVTHMRRWTALRWFDIQAPWQCDWSVTLNVTNPQNWFVEMSWIKRYQHLSLMSQKNRHLYAFVLTSINVINSSIINNLTTVQELSRTPENIPRQQNVSVTKLVTKRNWPALVEQVAGLKMRSITWKLLPTALAICRWIQTLQMCVDQLLKHKCLLKYKVFSTLQMISLAYISKYITKIQFLWLLHWRLD